MRVALLAIVVVVACGSSKASREPSNEKRDAEARAYAAMLDNRIERIRASHMCDDQITAAQKATTDVPSHISEFNLAEAKAKLAKMNAAADRMTACRALMPSAEENTAKSQSLADAWMDACVECAPGRECVAAQRAFRNRAPGWTLGNPDTEQRIELEQMKADPVCSPMHGRARPVVATATH